MILHSKEMSTTGVDNITVKTCTEQQKKCECFTISFFQETMNSRTFVNIARGINMWCPD